MLCGWDGGVCVFVGIEEVWYEVGEFGGVDEVGDGFWVSLCWVDWVGECEGDFVVVLIGDDVFGDFGVVVVFLGGYL